MTEIKINPFNTVEFKENILKIFKEEYDSIKSTNCIPNYDKADSIVTKLTENTVELLVSKVNEYVLNYVLFKSELELTIFVHFSYDVYSNAIIIFTNLSDKQIIIRTCNTILMSILDNQIIPITPVVTDLRTFSNNVINSKQINLNDIMDEAKCMFANEFDNHITEQVNKLKDSVIGYITSASMNLNIYLDYLRLPTNQEYFRVRLLDDVSNIVFINSVTINNVDSIHSH